MEFNGLDADLDAGKQSIVANLLQGSAFEMSRKILKVTKTKTKNVES